MTALLRKLISSDSGQDLVEYALLTAGIGVMGLATWPLIMTSLRNAYVAFDTNTQNLWSPPDPGGGS